MRKLVFLFLLLVLNFRLSAQIRVATASNLIFPAQEIKIAFEKKYGEKVDVITASSGVLCTQIQQGAPFDIFLSADMDYPETLFRENLTVASPKPFTFGQLIIWTSTQIAQKELTRFLESNAVKTIAIAQPALAPYGEEAIKYLKNNNLLEKVKNKLVYGESIGRVNQYIATGVVEVAFTSNSVMFAKELKNKGLWLKLPQKSRIPHGVVIIKSSNKMEQAQQFYQFLFSSDGQAILEKYGYTKVGE